MQVKDVEKKVDAVLIENMRLADSEKILEIRVKKVKVAELEEEKARTDEYNKYLELKNKELEVVKALKKNELYMMNKVIENMLGKSVEQRFEEIAVEEVRMKRQAEIDAQMKNKGKGVEGSEVAERSIVLSTIPNPVPISVVSAIFEEDVLLEDMGDDNIYDEEDDEEEKIDDPDDVISANSHSSDNDDDDDQGGTGVTITEASNEKNVDEYMNDDANEVSEDADGEGENVNDQNVDNVEKVES
ncbi:hypothetical protein Hanom_Chr13g01209911 [Helianthus anomalus]